MTFHTSKVGLHVAPGRFHAGDVAVVDIGLEPRADGRPARHPGAAPAGAAARRPRLEVHRRLGPRRRRRPRDDGGAGARARWPRCAPDAGYATLAVPRECLPVVETLALEPVKRGFDWDDAEDQILRGAERADAVALGPGLGRSPEAHALVARLLERLELPVVVDADALFGLEPFERVAPDGADAARGRARPPARARLGAGSTPTGSRRRGRVRSGSGPSSCSRARARSCSRPAAIRSSRDTGPPSLATAGTGDVLTGVVAASSRRDSTRHRRGAAATAHGLAAAVAPHQAGLSRATCSRSCRRRWGSLGRVKVEILGSGGAATIPRPGCRCRVCVEAREKGGRYARTGPSTFVHGPNILFDTPEESKLQLERAGDRRDRRVLLLALAPGPHDGAPRLGDAQRRLPHLAARGEAPARDRRLPPGAGRRRLPRLARRDGASRVHAGAAGWIRIHELRDGDIVDIDGVRVRPFRLAEDYVYAFELTEGDRTAARRDGRAERLVAAARGARAAISRCSRWGSASSTSSPGERLIHEEHPVLRFEATFEETLGIVAGLDAAQGRAQPRRGDGLHLVRRPAPGRGAAARGGDATSRFAWDGMTVDV